MRNRSLVLALVSVFASVFGVVAVEPAHSQQTNLPQIWVTVTSPPAKRNDHWLGIREDAADQWKPDAHWSVVANHTQVAKIGAQNIENTRDADLKATLAEVKRRGLKLALEIGPLVRTPACAPPTESYGRQGETEAILQKIRNDGGELDYVAMDEPWFYGHRDPGGCEASTAQIAQEVATSVASMRKIFPALKVGDIEVVDGDREATAQLAEWADAYRQATGEPLAFLHTDLAWSDLAIGNLAPLAANLKRRNIPFGIIYNADGSAASDAAWTQSAVSHFLEIEQVRGIHPDDAIFQTWTRNPTHVLPESQSGTLMNVALQYLQPSPRLHVLRSGGTVSGNLVGPGGAPLPGAAVALSAVDVGGRLWPTQRVLSDVIPEAAATAVIGVRAGLEGACICAGPTGAIIGGIHYREQGKPVQDVSPVSLPIQGAPMSLRTLALKPGQTYAPNLKQLPVTPGASFTLETWISATAAAENAGYVTIVFLDANGKGLGRRFLWLKPSVQPLGVATTDARGDFHLDLPPAIAAAEPEIRASFAGSATLKAALAIAAPPPTTANASLPALERTLSPDASPLLMLGPHAKELQAIFAQPPGAVSQWAQVAGQIQGIRLPGGAITAMPDDVLARLAQDLKARHIALGLEVLATNWFHEPPCGGGPSRAIATRDRPTRSSPS
ncbi:hypothetical protein [Bradyrhizobium genosp. A]|uniref:hypothetical protein n=1 Tax=Bradyrhizobium genosp. A TaxID=83626 RepID=UPI003CE98C89